MLTRPQLSLVPVGNATLTTCVHAPAAVLVTTLAGQVIVGCWVSFTVTLCGQIGVLPLRSVTVQVTTVVPTGYVPLALAVPLKLLVMLSRPQLSLVPVGKGTVTTCVHAPVVLVTTFPGQVIVGGWLSLTVTL